MNYDVVAMVVNLERQWQQEQARRMSMLDALPAHRAKKSHRLFSRTRKG